MAGQKPPSENVAEPPKEKKTVPLALDQKDPVKERVATREDHSDLLAFNRREDGVLEVIGLDDAALKETFGSESKAINKALFGQGLATLHEAELSDTSQDARGFVFAMVREIAPRDGFERMLATQMVATHVAFIRIGNRLASAQSVEVYEAFERSLNRLARTYTTQMEALRRHRTGGKQTVTVQHVNVEDGGQAIVGNVRSGGVVD